MFQIQPNISCEKRSKIILQEYDRNSTSLKQNYVSIFKTKKNFVNFHCFLK